MLDIEDNKIVPIIRDPATATADTEAVFYFPGCGSERLFSQVGLATQAMLCMWGCKPSCHRAICAAAIRSAVPANSIGQKGS